MKVCAINNSQYQPKQNQPSFKSTFPVVHWIAEVNGSYAPACGDLAEAFHEKIVSYLNKKLLTPKEVKELTKKKRKLDVNTFVQKKELNQIEKLKEIIDIPAQYLRAYLNSCDVSYRLTQKMRSFHNRFQESSNEYIPIFYYASGEHCKKLNELGEKIGRAYRESCGKETEKVKQAKTDYYKKGLELMRDYTNCKKDANGARQVLHTKFQIIRNNEGEITGYRYVDARFLPEYGPESPFEKLKNRK